MDTINGYVDDWAQNYHDSAKTLSIYVGNVDDEKNGSFEEISMRAPV